MDTSVTAKTLDYAAAAIVRCRRGKLKVLLMKTVKVKGQNAGLELWQLIGGMEEIVDQGNPLRTLNEELQEEAGLSLRENYPDPELIHIQAMPDGHTRRFYLVWREGLRGELRKQAILDGAFKRLESPEWRTVDFAKKNLCESHRAVLDYLIDLDLKHKGLR